MSAEALAQIYNFLQLGPDLATAGQPRPEQFQSVREAGFEIVINLALPTSDHAIPNEGSLVTALGLSYVHLPVKFGAPTARDFAAFRGVMRAFAGRRVFVHCAANMRVSAFMFLHRVLDGGVERTTAEKDLHVIWQPDAVWQRFIDEQLARGA